MGVVRGDPAPFHPHRMLLATEEQTPFLAVIENVQTSRYQNAFQCRFTMSQVVTMAASFDHEM